MSKVVQINLAHFIFIVIVILFAELEKLFCGVVLVNGKISQTKHATPRIDRPTNAILD
jgi:hypothetical protein